LGAVEAAEALAGAFRVVAEAPPRAVPARLIAVAVQRVTGGGALLEVTGRTTVACIADTADMLHCIPRGGIRATSLRGQMLLRPAGASVVAVAGAQGTLAGHPIVAGEAVAGAGGAVAGALIGALHPGMQIVGIHHVANPSEILRAGALRAIGTSPFRFSIQTSEAFAVIIHFAGAMIGAVILTQPTLSVSPLIPCNLTPTLHLVCGCRSWICAWLTCWTSGRLSRGLF